MTKSRGKSAVLALASTLAIAACTDVDPNEIGPVNDNNDDGQAASCVVSDVWSLPADGATDVARSSPLIIYHPGNVESVELVVTSGEGAVQGQSFVDAGRTLFIPDDSYPGGATVRWRATMCGKEHAGYFTTGELEHPLELDEIRKAYQGKAFALDTRAGSWRSPALMAGTPDGAAGRLRREELKWRFGPSFLVGVQEVEDDALRFVLAPAVSDAVGKYARDLARPALSLWAPLEGNPYVGFATGELDVLIAKQPAVLRDATFVLGLGEQGLEDSWLAGELDLRYYESEGKSGCQVALEKTAFRCRPCAHDGEPTCLLLEVRHIDGFATEASLAGRAGLPFAGPRAAKSEVPFELPKGSLPDRPEPPSPEPIDVILPGAPTPVDPDLPRVVTPPPEDDEKVKPRVEPVDDDELRPPEDNPYAKRPGKG